MIVRQVDLTTPEGIGTYVVCRTGDQTGGEIVLQVKYLPNTGMQPTAAVRS
jgi:hypothetical protein